MKETETLLSIIIPVYNVEKHLKNCVDSVIDESQSGYEIILVDDGSTDGSPAICDEYGEKYSFVKVIHKENGGLASARNAGLDTAAGEYLTFIDSDDFVEKGYIGCINKEVNTHSDVIAFPLLINDEEADCIVPQELPKRSNIPVREAVVELENSGNFDMVWNKIYKRDLIETNNQLRFHLLSEPGEDMMFNSLVFSKAESVSFFGKPFYHWIRRGEDTLANRFRKDLYERNKVFIEYRTAMYRELGLIESYFSVLSRENLDYIFACVPNMYRPGHRFSRKERLAFYREILNSEEVKGWIKNAELTGTLIKQFAILFKLNSSFILDVYYSFLMGVRNKTHKVWVRIRRKV